MPMCAPNKAFRQDKVCTPEGHPSDQTLKGPQNQRKLCAVISRDGQPTCLGLSHQKQGSGAHPDQAATRKSPGSQPDHLHRNYILHGLVRGRWHHAPPTAINSQPARHGTPPLWSTASQAAHAFYS
mmetsp:Transcript_21388/g.59272  ORF Transcript_21388/g.59272 Transcript_21388/m.59272 type:complete len:126 (-) Transcript_21388:397-774(-)